MLSDRRRCLQVHGAKSLLHAQQDDGKVMATALGNIKRVRREQFDMQSNIKRVYSRLEMLADQLDRPDCVRANGFVTDTRTTLQQLQNGGSKSSPGLVQQASPSNGLVNLPCFKPSF